MLTTREDMAKEEASRYEEWRLAYIESLLGGKPRSIMAHTKKLKEEQEMITANQRDYSEAYDEAIKESLEDALTKKPFERLEPAPEALGVRNPKVNDIPAPLVATSDGSTAKYYELPPDAKELQDLISYRNMNRQVGEIFAASYRYGQNHHSSKIRDMRKIRFYADAEIERLIKYEGAK